MRPNAVIRADLMVSIPARRTEQRLKESLRISALERELVNNAQNEFPRCIISSHGAYLTLL